MQCPACDEKLREIKKYGVLVDICPSCKGVWLDRGELEKIAALEERDDSDRNYRDKKDDYRGDDHEDHRSRGDYRYSKPKRRSFLSDLMEGFGD